MEPRLVCADCGNDFDLSWRLACPECGCKYITPSHRWTPHQLRLFTMPRG